MLGAPAQMLRALLAAIVLCSGPAGADLPDAAPPLAPSTAPAPDPAPDPAAAAPEPDTYRSPPYQAPVPATLAGARVIGAAEAMALHAKGVPFIDVYPRTRRPAGLPQGTLWREPVHDSIPSALWLPDTGYDRLAPAEAARLKAGLAAASHGDMRAPLVIFCRADCWLSWNAARRAVAMGYRGVIWFPQGSDGWLAEGGDLAPAKPPPH